MLSNEVFRPAPAGTISISAGTSNATGTLNAAVPNNITCHVYNDGPSTAFVEFGGLSTVAASSVASMPIASKTFFRVNIDQCAYASAICGSGTALVYFTKGYGL